MTPEQKSGHELANARLEAGWSQAGLARAIGVQPSHLCHIEKGERKLTTGIAYQAERVMQLGHDSLVRHALDLTDTVRSSIGHSLEYVSRTMVALGSWVRTLRPSAVVVPAI